MGIYCYYSHYHHHQLYYLSIHTQGISALACVHTPVCKHLRKYALCICTVLDSRACMCVGTEWVGTATWRSQIKGTARFQGQNLLSSSFSACSGELLELVLKARDITCAEAAGVEAADQQITLTERNTNIRAVRAGLLRRTVLIITFNVSYRIVRG